MGNIIDTIDAAVTSMQVDSLPVFSYGTWNEESNRIVNLKNVLEANRFSFPLIFLFLPMREHWIESEQSYESLIRLYIIGTTNKDYTPQQRHANEMPALRVYETTLKTKLKNYSVKYTDFDREEFMYNEAQLATPVNAIELEIPAIYQIQCLT